MKIKLTITLDISDKYENDNIIALSSMFYENYIKYISRCRQSDLLKWEKISKKSNTEQEDIYIEQICENHKEWIQITKPSFSFYTVEKVNDS
jgi:hypothetical protein